MQLTYINGSPRGRKGNTDKHVNNFIEGFSSMENTTCERYYLNQYRQKQQELADIFWSSENVMIGFPLYVDSVPGSLKAFFEVLHQEKGRAAVKVMFLGQCGFPETHHMRFVEKYLKKFTERIGCTYLGSIMKGGGEGLHIQPPQFTEKTFSRLQDLGAEFAETGMLNEKTLSRISHPEHLSIEQITGLIPYINANLWDKWMEEHGALEKSFNRPYVK
jgi:NAD(P)H-dependent FMN reductase